MQTRVDPSTWGIVSAAAPLHVILALSTDLSPDEAYYLCAARAGGALPPLIDHPPLLPWLFRAADTLTILPVELRIRLVPIVCSLALALLCVEIARRRGATAAGRAFVAWITSFALLPMTAGFVATPDGPALLAIALGLLWASPTDPPGRRRVAAATAVGAALALGALAKVIVLPAALLFAAAASKRSMKERLALLAPVLLGAPLLVPSLRFQMHHAFVGQHHAWSLAKAVGALAEAAGVQALLWSPAVLLWGLQGAKKLPPPDRWLLASMSALVGLSAILRAAPPEANWWAPAALIVVVNAGATASLRSSRARRATLTSVIVPTAIALLHTVRPFLPLPAHADPTARLHGWSQGDEPIDAAGVGPYGPAAERCVYRGSCAEIANYFNRMAVSSSGIF